MHYFIIENDERNQDWMVTCDEDHRVIEVRCADTKEDVVINEEEKRWLQEEAYAYFADEEEA